MTIVMLWWRDRDGLWLVTWLLLMVTLVSTFNLDVRIPIIKRAGVHSDSYFGYSVAQHRTRRGSRTLDEFLDEVKILVGAPRDENLQPETNRSGALYQCSMSSDIQVSSSLGRVCLLCCKSFPHFLWKSIVCPREEEVGLHWSG